VALDLKAIRKTVIDSIKAAVGDDLSQTFNPALNETYGTVLIARPNGELPIPEYPYAVLDILGIRDTAWYLTTRTYDETTGKFSWETHRTLDIQISIYGDNNLLDALSIANKLSVSYRMESIQQILIDGGLGLASVDQVQILPELLQTDWLNVAFLKLSIRANDKYVDADLAAIESINITGGLYDATVIDPLPITI